jgi:putative transposase
MLCFEHAKPKIFNTDQAAQFISAAFTSRLEAAGIAISMDGRGRFAWLSMQPVGSS